MKYSHKTLKPTRYHFKCTNCPKTRISANNIPGVTELCTSCNNKKNPPTKGNNKHGFMGTRREIGIQTNKHNREKNKKEHTVICGSCGNEHTVFTTSKKKDNCLLCANTSKTIRKNNKSGYIGVHYKNPVHKKNGGYEQGMWRSVILQNRVVIFNISYKDSYQGNDEYKKNRCAVDRELHIIENDLLHTRNFTDKELDAMCNRLDIMY